MGSTFPHFGTYVAQGEDGNPKSARDDHVPVPVIGLPRGRLARLGVAASTVDLYATWWETLDGDGARSAAMRDLALLSDGQLTAQAADVAELPDASAAHIESWARRQPNRKMAAAMALAVEESRPAPRAGLVRKLGTIR